MNSLLDELFDLICFNLICITDIRNLSMVCKKYNLKCKQKIIDMEIYYKQKYKKLDLVDFFNEHSIEKFTIEIILDDYCNLLPEKYYSENNKIMCSVLALCGKFELLKYAHSKSCQINNYSTTCAAYNGHIDILDWIINNTKITLVCTNICNNSSRNGHTNVLNWLHLNSFDIEKDTCIAAAIINDHLNILEWLLQHDMTNTKISKCAAATGKINILQWTHDNKLIKDNSFCNDGACNGQIKVLQWAKDNNYKIENIDYSLVIKNGHINVIEWLYNNSYTINVNICDIAIKYDNINILIWTINHGYTCSYDLVEFAITYNSTLTLQWALENNYKISENIYKNAIEGGQYEILEWIIKNNLPTKPMELNVTYTNHDIINLLLKHDLLIVTMKNCMNLLTTDINTIQLIGEKYFVIKEQFHIIIKNNTIKYESYGTNYNCNNQKIIRYGSDGNIDICDFNCDYKCWWYFMMYCLNENNDVNSFAKEKINNCHKHKKYLNTS